jgi:hypothetical protein
VQDAARERDVLGGEPLGVAAPVEALVQVQHRCRDLFQAGAGDDVAAQLGMALHDRELGGVELGGLEQDHVGDADLADVVQDAGGAQLLEPLLA